MSRRGWEGEDGKHRRTAEKTSGEHYSKKEKKKQHRLRAIKHHLVFGGDKVKQIQHGEAVFIRMCSGLGAAAPSFFIFFLSVSLAAAASSPAAFNWSQQYYIRTRGGVCFQVARAEGLRNIVLCLLFVVGSVWKSISGSKSESSC